jgi:RecX family
MSEPAAASVAAGVATLFRHAVTRLLSARAHSAGELQQKLTRSALKRKLTAQHVAGALEQLKEAKLINDQEFAEWFVAQRAAGKKCRSSAEINQELRLKGVDAAIIDAALAQHSDLPSCVRFALKKPQRSLTRVQLRSLLFAHRYSVPSIEAVLAARDKNTLHLLCNENSAPAGDNEEDEEDEGKELQ